MRVVAMMTWAISTAAAPEVTADSMVGQVTADSMATTVVVLVSSAPKYQLDRSIFPEFASRRCNTRSRSIPWSLRSSCL